MIIKLTMRPVARFCCQLEPRPTDPVSWFKVEPLDNDVFIFSTRHSTPNWMIAGRDSMYLNAEDALAALQREVDEPSLQRFIGGRCVVKLQGFGELRGKIDSIAKLVIGLNDDETFNFSEFNVSLNTNDFFEFRAQFGSAVIVPGSVFRSVESLFLATFRKFYLNYAQEGVIVRDADGAPLRLKRDDPQVWHLADRAREFRYEGKWQNWIQFQKLMTDRMKGGNVFQIGLPEPA